MKQIFLITLSIFIVLIVDYISQTTNLFHFSCISFISGVLGFMAIDFINYIGD